MTDATSEANRTSDTGRTPDADRTTDTDDGNPDALWSDDTGHLPGDSRRALLALLKGPYLARSRQAQLWQALLRDESALRQRLHDLFLDLVLDPAAEVAFVRNVAVPEQDLPKAVRSAPLTFLDTGLLLVLRQHLLEDGGGVERVIVGKDEIYEQLEIYRDDASDTSGFVKRMNASWSNMKKYGLIADASTEDERVEISPVLRLVFGPDEIAAVRDEYRRLAARRDEVGE